MPVAASMHCFSKQGGHGPRAWDGVSRADSEMLIAQLRACDAGTSLQPSPQPCIIIPTVFAALVLEGIWTDLVVPSPFAARWGMSNSMLASSIAKPLHQLQVHLKQMHDNSEDTLPLPSVTPFDATHCQALADDLRTLLATQHTVWLPHHKAALQKWIFACQQTVEQRSVQSYPWLASGAARQERLLHVLSFADHLKNADSLPRAIITACKLVLAPVLLAEVQQQVEKHRPPNKSTVSRFRLCLDSAYMLLQRCKNRCWGLDN